MEHDSRSKPFVQIAINEVNSVVYDPEGHYPPDRFDRYATFEEARDAALCCVEVMLDEEDYDGADHRAELETMLGLLESAESYDELEASAEYRWFLDRLDPASQAAA